ncbi:MAG: carboxypeptidase M32 [Candidatus Pacearchaeota archaeon]|jgi:carboxypeptidase Taq
MGDKLIKHPFIIEILDKYKVIWSLNHLGALGSWDLSVYMPEEGALARGEALGKVATLSQKLFLDKEFTDLIKKADNEKDLNDYERAVIRMLKRSLKYYEKLPPEFIEEFSRVVSKSQIAWKKAKEQDNFSIFEPYLEKIVELTKKKAEYLGYSKHPYDALLDEYEEGLTVEEVEKYFISIKQPLIDLIKYIKNSKKFRKEHELENQEYDVEKMKKLNDKMLNFIHYNMNHIRIDVSSHPFSISLGKGDVRITTRYEGHDFARSYSSTIHEYGHALYEIQSHDDLHYTPIAGGSSLVIHESQSRFWENFIGKSRGFISLMYKDILEVEDKFKNFSIDQIYDYVNLVKPSLIRTESDEVTYHLHIMIRFEIEKALIEGKIKVSDLPKVWNDKYEEYLGIRPTNNREGILQDVHWSQGSIGYFPTYSLGTALSAMWKHHLEKDIGNIEEVLKTKEGIKKIQDWLKENIHQYGSTYMFRDLVKKTTHEEFSSKYLLDYLNKKYKEIY